MEYTYQIIMESWGPMRLLNPDDLHEQINSLGKRGFRVVQCQLQRHEKDFFVMIVMESAS